MRIRNAVCGAEEAQKADCCVCIDLNTPTKLFEARPSEFVNVCKGFVDATKSRSNGVYACHRHVRNTPCAEALNITDVIKL